MAMTRLTVPIIFLILILIVVPASAQIRAEVGETWIRFEWPPIEDTTIMIDGTDSGPGDRGTYYLTGVNPNEEHQIEVVDTSSGEVKESARVSTLTPLSTILFFISIEMILAILCLILEDPIRVVLTGALGGTLGFYVFGLCVGHGSLWLVVLGLIGFQALFVILALYNLFEDALKWW